MSTDKWHARNAYVTCVVVLYILCVVCVHGNEYKQKVSYLVYTGHMRCTAYAVCVVCSKVGTKYACLRHVLCVHV